MQDCIEGSNSKVQFWGTVFKWGVKILKAFWVQTEDGEAPNSLDAPSFATGYCVAKCE